MTIFDSSAELLRRYDIDLSNKDLAGLVLAGMIEAGLPRVPDGVDIDKIHGKERNHD